MILQPLSELLPKHYEPGISREPITPFFAEFRGKVYTVKSVLERTAVLMNTEDFYDRRLGKLTEVLVDPAILSWRTDTGSRFTDGGQPDPAGKARLRGRVASLVTAARKRSGEIPQTRPKTELQIIRESGRLRCHNATCRHIGPPEDFNRNGYCKVCGRIYNRRYGYAWKKARREAKAGVVA